MSLNGFDWFDATEVELILRSVEQLSFGKGLVMLVSSNFLLRSNISQSPRPLR